jgi:hypothetical protein
LNEKSNLQGCLLSPEFLGSQYVAARVPIEFDCQKRIADRECPDPIPFDLVSSECFDETGDRFMRRDVYRAEKNWIMFGRSASDDISPAIGADQKF